MPEQCCWTSPGSNSCPMYHHHSISYQIACVICSAEDILSYLGHFEWKLQSKGERSGGQQGQDVNLASVVAWKASAHMGNPAPCTPWSREDGYDRQQREAMSPSGHFHPQLTAKFSVTTWEVFMEFNVISWIKTHVIIHIVAVLILKGLFPCIWNAERRCRIESDEQALVMPMIIPF